MSVNAIKLVISAADPIMIIGLRPNLSEIKDVGQVNSAWNIEYAHASTPDQNAIYAPFEFP